MNSALNRILLTLGLSLVLCTPIHAQQGRDGHVKIIYWQAPSTLNPYLSAGIKDIESASLILEPLARHDEQGNMLPWLAEEIPTIDNGGINNDLSEIIWKLRSDIVWSDGTPFTAADVVFTADYCMHEESGCTGLAHFRGVMNVKAMGTHTVKITFDSPAPYPYGPFVGARTPILQASQFAACVGANASDCTEQNSYPIGTGPFKAIEFQPDDVVRMVANPNYREQNKPAFSTLTLKGGGDAAAASRAVMETGEFDYAWNILLPPNAIAELEKGNKGKLVGGFGTLVEWIMVNLTDPAPGLGEQGRSTSSHPHPFLSDLQVRRALSMAIDRNRLVEVGYGKAGKITCNVIPAPQIYRSSANEKCMTQDIVGANALLDKAGWVDTNGNGVRDKDGVELKLLYQTSTNAVRQDFQNLIRKWWLEIGVETELRKIDASVFFGSDSESPDTLQKFYADVQMYANMFSGTDPQSYLASWLCADIPRPESQWQGGNIPRFCSLEYDELHERLTRTAGISERARIVRQLNDILVQEHVIIPLVHRGRISVHANSLGGVVFNTLDSELWNVADWYRISE